MKINSPHMNIICTINQNILYDEAVEKAIPFFKVLKNLKINLLFSGQLGLSKL